MQGTVRCFIHNAERAKCTYYVGPRTSPEAIAFLQLEVSCAQRIVSVSNCVSIVMWAYRCANV